MGVLDDAIREHLELKRRHGASEDELKRQEDEALSPVRREPRAAQEPDDAAAALDEPPTGERFAPDRIPGSEDADDEALSDEVPAGERLDADEPDFSVASAAPTELLDAAGPRETLDERLLDEEEFEEEALAEELAADGAAVADRSADDELLSTDDGLAEDDEELAADEDGLLAADAEPAPRSDEPAAEDPGLPAGDEELAAESDELAAAEEAAIAEEDALAAGPPSAPVAAEDEDEAVTEEQPVPNEARGLRSEPEVGAEDELELSDEQEEDVLEETPDFLQETPEDERLWFEQRPPRDFDLDR